MAAEGLTPREAESLLFRSYMRAAPLLRGPDELTRRPDLTATLLADLGHPERGLPCVLVAGSKGKGSTAAFSDRLLRGAGLRVGLFTSPHLLDVRERIRVDGRAISPDDFVRLVELARPAIDALDAQLTPPAYLSPVGLLLAIALLYFHERGVQAGVIEAGRGARFDDTRVVEHPAAAITPIYVEHDAQLGPGLRRIAWHKAGAISEGGVVATARQRAEVLKVLAEEASRRGARLRSVGRALKTRVSADGTGSVRTPLRGYTGLRPGLLGRHQVENLAVALASVEALYPPFERVPDESIRAAVATTRVPGRSQILQRDPLVLLDGTINRAGARAFLAAAQPLSRGPISAVVAVPSDKDYPGVLRTIAPHVRRLWLTRATNPTLHFDDAPLHLAQQLHRAVTYEPDPARAIDAAMGSVGSEGAVWLLGTQSFVADALRSALGIASIESL
jgi:dihydrofolate synthase/folylpolyglutamate synthase